MTSSTTHARRWWTLAVLSLSLVIIALDNTVINVALPTLVTELDATSSELQWIVDAYVLVFAGLLLTMGALGDRFGRKKALIVGLVIFGMASITAAMSSTAGALTTSRAVMGVGAALIMPATLSIIANVFSGRERGRAIAIWAGTAGLGIILGPLLGGWLLEQFYWGSVFLINVGVVAVALVSGLYLVPESKDPGATPLDLWGAALSVGGLTTLLFGVIEAPARGWSDPLVVGAFVASVVLIAVFIWWESRTPHPMTQLTLFENPRFSAASGAIGLVFFAMVGTLFLLTQHLQFVLGFSPLEAGVRIMPVATVVVAAPLSARLNERFGTKIVVSAGLAIATIGLALYAGIASVTGYLPVGVSLAILGLGMGTAMAPATDSIMGSLPPGKAGVGSAMNFATRQVGGALGVAILGSLLAVTYSAAMEPAVAALPDEAAAVASDSIGGAQRVAAELGEEGAPLVASSRVAFVEGMQTALWVALGVALIGTAVTWLFLPAREQAPVPVEVDSSRSM